MEELSPVVVHDIVRLRADVFVVEQRCAYADLDGRDVEPGALWWWIADPPDAWGTHESSDAAVIAAARTLVEPGATRIGRLATRHDRRGRGLAAAIVTRVLSVTPGPWVLDAQARLQSWYEGLGFAPSGPVRDVDGIAHVPMRAVREVRPTHH